MTAKSGLGDGAARREPLLAFCRGVEAIVERERNAESAARPVGDALMDLLAAKDWLDPAWLQDEPHAYQQHPLYIDPAKRFSVVSFVWGPGQSTPIHDHGVWGVVGVLIGAERTQRYRQGEDGRVAAHGPTYRLAAGEVDLLLPSEGDIHRVENALQDQVSISIHVYGADIGTLERRSLRADGAVRSFVSGYSATPPALATLHPAAGTTA